MNDNDKKIMFACRISKGTKHKLKLYAVMNDISVQDAVEQIIKTYLDTLTGGSLK